MANVVTKANSTTTPYTDTTVKRDLAAAAATYYIGSMIALDASGNAVKCDDTAGIKFDGIAVGFNSQGGRVTVPSGGTAGDFKVTVDRPYRFTMPIAAAVAGDEGTKVYAAYDGTVTKSATSNSILVGKIDRVLSATEVEIIPIYGATLSVATFDGSTLTFTGSGTGTSSIVIADNLADALSVQEGSNKYITFITTNSGEFINILKSVKFGGATGANLITLVDNLASALDITEAANSYLKFTTTDSSEAVVIGKSTTVAGTVVITSASATAFAVGRLGSTTPALLVDASTATSITGISVKSAASGNGVAVAAIGETNVNTTIDAKGSGTLTLGGTSTGNVKLTGGGGIVVVTGTLTAGGLLTCAVQVATSGPLVYSGSSAPTISAAVKGSLYLRTDGSSSSTRAYIATDTAGTWTAITTAA